MTFSIMTLVTTTFSVTLKNDLLSNAILLLWSVSFAERHMLNVTMLSITMLIATMLSVSTMSVTMLSVTILSVVALM